MESDFSMILAFSILYFGVSLLESFAENTSKLNADITIIKKSTASARHPLYSGISIK